MGLNIVCIKSIRGLVVGNLYYYDKDIYYNNGERILYAIFDSRGNLITYLSLGQIEFNFISLSECMRELDVLEKNFNFFMDYSDIKIFET
jgi:hypothetical protein